jgi:hypothetical protein
VSYYLKIIRDNPIGLWKLDETSGTSAYDSSGCSNHATYSGTFINNLIPLVPGGIQATKITSSNSISFPIVKDYYQQISKGNVADKYSIDNDFSIELWFYPKIKTNNKTIIFADSQNNIGLYYEKGNIIFQVGDQYTEYTIPYIKKSHHIIAVYSVKGLSLYIDGKNETNKQLLSKIVLNNISTTFQSGPTENASDYFLIDSVSLYRYSLTKEMAYSHYNYGQPISIYQVSSSEQGILFTLNDQNLKKVFNYSYPFTKDWTNFVNSDITHNKLESSIQITPTENQQEKNIEFVDFISVPLNDVIQYSKIEWLGENGISVQTSTDGITYIECENGKSLPQYRYNNFHESGNIYIKFILSTSDASRYIPKLNYLNISFYINKDISAENYGDTINPIQNEYFLGNKNYNLLSRDSRNGLRCTSNSGFILNTDKLIKSIEFFYTPEYSELIDSAEITNISPSVNSIINAEINNVSAFSGSAEYVSIDNQKGLLVYSELTENGAESEYSWDEDGSINQTNISSIYINGQEKTSETNINNVFIQDEMHHVVITYTEVISNDIKFNYLSSESVEALYKNISIYSNELTQTEIENHYNLYVEKPAISASINDTALMIDEQEAILYNNDWVVLQSS